MDLLGASGPTRKFAPVFGMYRRTLICRGDSLVLLLTAALFCSPYLLQSTADAAALVDDFLRLCWYRPGKSYGDAPAVTSILRETTTTSSSSSSNLLVYLAIPPHVFGDATQAVKTALQSVPMRAGFTRIVLEKPFGRDTDSCRALLNVLKEQEWEERDLYRIDVSRHQLRCDTSSQMILTFCHSALLGKGYCPEHCAFASAQPMVKRYLEQECCPSRPHLVQGAVWDGRSWRILRPM